MQLRIRLCRPWFWSVVLLVLSAVPASAQPPSPLELVRGLREHGQVDLAMEYLKDLEKQPLSPDDKAALLLERAKCLLDLSESEPDEATRVGMVSEAREGLKTFLIKHPKHPRIVEALLTDAKLTAIDAREQLNRARRMEIPPPSEKPDEAAARDAALQKQKAEAQKALPLFQVAAKQFNEASAQLLTRLEDKSLDPGVRRALEREAAEALLASGINQFNTAETFMPASLMTGKDKEDRNKYLEQAKITFNKLAGGPPNNRTIWVARAWMAEVTYEQDDFNNAVSQVQAILKAPVVEADDGKRLAHFFQLRRDFLAALGEKNLQKVQKSESDLRDWLRVYGSSRKPTPELYAVRYYLARVLQSLGENAIGPPPKNPPKTPAPIPGAAMRRFEEAERLYRALAQTDHDYTARATRQRMVVVLRMLGDADQPASTYDTFEKAQMASLIQLSKLAKAEAMPDKTEAEIKKKNAEVKNRQMKTIALLERSRELATPQDNPADVTDVLLRLIYFYQLTNQPLESAVLGEFGAYTIKATGGKAALAGLFGINGYVLASVQAKGAEARKTDRDRAAALARFLDEKYPNDNHTDTARHRLASILMEDKLNMEAFEILLKIRPAYSQITDVRLLEGYLAGTLVNPKDSPLPPAKKLEIFRRAIADLARAPKPVNVALKHDVRSYLSARLRLASLMFAQGRADPEAEKANPGYNQALAIAQEVMGVIPTFTHLTKDGGKALDLDGLEMMMLARDVYARAIYLRARALTDQADKLTGAEKQAKLDEATKTLQSIIDDVTKNGPLFTAEMKKWSEGGDEDDSVHKAKIAQLAGVVDKTRIDVILADFRLKVKQAKAAEAEALLDLMVKAGGKIEDSLPLLEPVGRELAAQMVKLRREGKKAEADALGAGLAVLLKKISTVPKLPTTSIMFTGQMLIEVGEFGKAIETLKKIPAPEFDGWQTKKQEEIPAELRGRVQGQIRDYASAQYGIARALRESKKFDEAEKLLKSIIGTPDKQGWGAGRLYFRKELATLYEDKGAAATETKAASNDWGLALREWTTLFNLQRNRLQKPPPGTTPDQMKDYRNNFADAYFDINRCTVKANQQLLKDPKFAAKLQKTYDDVGKRFADMEKQKDFPATDWKPEIQNRYAEFLKEVPQVLAAYKTNGGKLFLEKLPLQ